MPGAASLSRVFVDLVATAVTFMEEGVVAIAIATVVIVAIVAVVVIAIATVVILSSAQSGRGSEAGPVRAKARSSTTPKRWHLFARGVAFIGPQVAFIWPRVPFMFQCPHGVVRSIVRSAWLLFAPRWLLFALECLLCSSVPIEW